MKHQFVGEKLQQMLTKKAENKAIKVNSKQFNWNPVPEPRFLKIKCLSGNKIA